MPINYLEKITELFAFVSVDEGGEGIVGQTVVIDDRLVFMPFVCADKARVDTLRPLAKQIHMRTGQKIKLIKLTKRTELEEIG